MKKIAEKAAAAARCGRAIAGTSAAVQGLPRRTFGGAAGALGRTPHSPFLLITVLREEPNGVLHVLRLGDQQDHV